MPKSRNRIVKIDRDRHDIKDEISVDRVLKYDVWTLNINSSTRSDEIDSAWRTLGERDM